MGLRDKLKQSVQKVTRAVALTAGVTAGLSGAEARAEITSNTNLDQMILKSVSDEQERRSVFASFKSANRVRPDIKHVMASLNLIDEKGRIAFTYDDVVAAQDYWIALDQVAGYNLQKTPYTEYEQKIIDDAAIYLSSKSLIDGKKEEIKKRIYQVLEASGNPKISYTKNSNSLTASLLRHGRSNYSPIGHIYINEASDFVPELSHAFRDNNNVMGEVGNFVVDGLKDIFTLTSTGFSEDAQAQNYKKTGYMEHDTHSIVEPVLEQYLVQDPLSEYREIRTIDEATAMIDILRHQQKDNSAVYTWTTEGDQAVDRGKESLRNQYLNAFFRDEKLMEKLVQDAANKPLLRNLFVSEKEDMVKMKSSKENTAVNKPLSPILMTVLQKKHVND